jgi:hypothetical protein
VGNIAPLPDERELPIRAKARTEMEEPKLAQPIIDVDSTLPAFARPCTLNEDPMRAAERSESVEPRFAKPKMDIELPNLANERMESEDPN